LEGERGSLTVEEAELKKNELVCEWKVLAGQNEIVKGLNKILMRILPLVISEGHQ